MHHNECPINRSISHFEVGFGGRERMLWVCRSCDIAESERGGGCGPSRWGDALAGWMVLLLAPRFGGACSGAEYGGWLARFLLRNGGREMRSHKVQALFCPEREVYKNHNKQQTVLT